MVNDRSTELELLYIDDLVEGMFDLLEGKEQHCTFDGVETVLCDEGQYCCVPVTHKVTSAGSNPCAIETRFCTLTAAISGSVP